MVKKLLAPKRDGLHPDYELDFFERTLKEAFEVERSERLESGHARAVLRTPEAVMTQGARPKSAGWAYLNLAVLWTFAVAQPLFDLLKDNPEFFAARGSSGFDIISFSVLLVVLPPAILLAIELLLGPDPARGAPGGARVFLGALVVLIAAQALKKAIDTSDTVLIVLSRRDRGRRRRCCGRARSRCARSSTSCRRSRSSSCCCSCSAARSPSSPSRARRRRCRSAACRARRSSWCCSTSCRRTRCVDQNDRLDTKRYPGFGELATNATWFRNAYTVYDSTERAQPAIMDGNLPEKDKQPISSDHPNSIFSLFAKSHRHERRRGGDGGLPARPLHEPRSATSRTASGSRRWRRTSGSSGCTWSRRPTSRTTSRASPRTGATSAAATRPRCRRRSSGSPVHTRANLNGGRPARFQAWMQRIVPGHRPALNFKHTLMPHVPWQYLPSGRLYRRQPNDAIPALSNQAYEDHGAARRAAPAPLPPDRLRRLRAAAALEAAEGRGAVGRVADRRGGGPRRGVPARPRAAPPEPARPPARSRPIPLFIKAPGQKKREGRTTPGSRRSTSCRRSSTS